MASSLSGLTGNLAEGLHKGKCKDCKPSIEYMTDKDVVLTFKCLNCNKSHEKKFDEEISQ